ncbi:motility associated factor glycosyltransferase family protein [Campylobacter sp. VTCC 70190]|uniref:motility associated factor glycosyltransferase family protein n=1 Tax=Campylobacter sp. VTCC 70190 TaxID=3392118 RepID=UPI00398EA887
MDKELFLKNTQALFEVDEILAYKLRMLTHLNFGILQNENGVNFSKDTIFLYENPQQEFLENLSLFQSEYKKYPVLYFYGFGNGMFYKALCENKNHKKIIVFEDDLEILALAFHLFDFTKELKSEKLILFHSQTLNTAQLSTLYMNEILQKSVKIFKLFIHSDFYQKFYSTQIQEVQSQLIEMIRFIVLNKGNDPHDSLIGIKHTLDNIPKMLRRGIFQAFLKERRAKAKNAIIVSTGPSLIKQLPLLKKYANKAVIFCADSAYSILAKNDIKPDYVCMIERDEVVAECFNNDFKDFNKGILFIIASVVHRNAIDFLQRDGRVFMLVHRPLNFAASLKLDEYGYIGVGHSVSNMSYEMAGALRFDNIIFIGQDLAYAEDGSSHPKEHIYGSHSEEIEGESYTTAYGGEGRVRTQLSWNLFRQAFEKDIFWAKERLGINTYNCTEGGARIEGSIEKPFLWACENLLNEDLNKPFDFPKSLNQKAAKEKQERLKKQLQKGILEAKEFTKKTQTQLQKLKYTLEKKGATLKEEDFHTLEKIKNNLLHFFKEFKELKLFNELSQAIYFHNECEILKFEVLSLEKQKANLIDFLKIQYNWFMQGLGYLDTQNQTLEKALKNWDFVDMEENNLA